MLRARRTAMGSEIVSPGNNERGIFVLWVGATCQGLIDGRMRQSGLYVKLSEG